MKTTAYILTEDDEGGRTVEGFPTLAEANNAAAASVAISAQSYGLTDCVTSDNWHDILSRLQVKGCDDCVWVDEVEIELPAFGPLAITCDGGLVQDVVSDDTRLHGIDCLVIDYEQARE